VSSTCPTNIIHIPLFGLLYYSGLGVMVLFSMRKPVVACYHSVQNNFSSHLLSENIKIRIYKTIILPVVLYGCKTWSVTIKGGTQTEGVWEQRCWGEYLVQTDEVTGDWIKLHNEELHNLHSSPNTIRMIKSRRMRWAGHIARMGAKRDAYRILVGKPDGKRPLGRPRRRWVGGQY
jgi:hypothetical protein